MFKIRFWRASSNTYGDYHDVEMETLDVMDIAYKYGRGEWGEVIQIIEVDGKEVDPANLAYLAHWSSQYGKYVRVREY